MSSKGGDTNKMVKIRLILVIILILFILSGCYKKAGENAAIPTNTTEEAVQSSTTPIEIDDSEAPTVSESTVATSGWVTRIIEEGGTTYIAGDFLMPPEKLNEQRVVEQVVEVTRRGLIYKVNSVKISKTTEGFPEDKISYLSDDSLDSSGALKAEFSYVIVNLTIKNSVDSEVELYLNSNKFKGVNDNQEFDEISCEEIQGFDKSQFQKNSKSFYKYIFKPNEELNCNVLGILKDIDFEKDIYLSLDISEGSELGATNHIKIFMKER